MAYHKVLITGGSGFVGSHLVRKFHENKYNVSIFDIQEPPFDLPEGASFIKGNIFDLENLKNAIADTDVVVHLVGLADSGIAEANPMKSFHLNVVSLQNVLETCRICENKKIIFPSSAAIYGITEDLPIKENFPPNPTSIYAWHKVICEKMIQAYQKSYDLRYVILRFFNVYGKGNEGVMGIFLNKAKSGEEIESFGPFQYRDFVYAGDVSEAIYRAAAYDKAVNRTINIGSGRGIQIREILDITCEIHPDAKWSEKKANFIMYDSIADITLAKILLDFNPHASREFIKEIMMHEMK